MADVSIVYFGERFHDETGGEWGTLVDETNLVRVEWEHVIAAVLIGCDVAVRHASESEKQIAAGNLARYKSQKECERLDRIDALIDQATQ
jgi:hypothetical protein